MRFLFMLCMCDDTCQINVLYHTTTKCRHRYVDQQTCTICTYTMQNMKCKRNNYIIFVWLSFCTLFCALVHVMHVRWCAANKRFVPHNKKCRNRYIDQQGCTVCTYIIYMQNMKCKRKIMLFLFG